MISLSLFTTKFTLLHRIVAFGVINTSGLNVDSISISFSISLILPNLSFTFSFTFCVPISSKLTSIFLLFSSVDSMFVLFGLEKLRSYVSSSNLFSTSISDDKLASSLNFDGYFRSFVCLLLNCAIGSEDSIYIWVVSIFDCHNSSSTVNFTVYDPGSLNC